MIIESDPVEALSRGEFGDDMHHVACCHDEDLGLCGADLTDSDWRETPAAGEQECAVCYDLDATDCTDADGCCGCLCCAVFVSGVSV